VHDRLAWMAKRRYSGGFHDSIMALAHDAFVEPLKVSGSMGFHTL
jgi:hypothetical protein